MTAESPSDRYAATNTIAGKITALRDEMRATVPAVDDPQAKALLETGAEVLNGLQHAFIDYADGSEEAWQRYAAARAADISAPRRRRGEK